MNRKKSKKWSKFIIITFFLVPALYYSLVYFTYKRPIAALTFNLLFKKKERYAGSLKGHKIVFGGGSNVIYGIRTSDVENKLKIPTVNLSMSAGLTIGYILKFIKKNVNKGDIVILPYRV